MNGIETLKRRVDGLAPAKAGGLTLDQMSDYELTRIAFGDKPSEFIPTDQELEQRIMVLEREKEQR